jgi:dipeptide/tripeptide permease
MDQSNKFIYASISTLLFMLIIGLLFTFVIYNNGYGILINLCVASLFLFWLVKTDFKKSSQNYKVPKSEQTDSNKTVSVKKNV